MQNTIRGVGLREQYRTKPSAVLASRPSHECYILRIALPLMYNRCIKGIACIKGTCTSSVI